MSRRITFGVDAFGNRLGEAHHRAKISDKDVEDIRDAYETGMFSYARLAKRYGISKTQVQDIVTFRRRATSPEGYKSVKIDELKRPFPEPKDIDMFDVLDEEGVEDESLTTGVDAVAQALGSTRNRAENVLDDLVEDDPYA